MALLRLPSRAEARSATQRGNPESLGVSRWLARQSARLFRALRTRATDAADACARANRSNLRIRGTSMTDFQRIIPRPLPRDRTQGHNRASFEMRLLKNLEALLAPFPVVTIHRIAGRLLVFLREGTDWETAKLVSDAIGGIPGVARVSCGFKCARELDVMAEAALVALAEAGHLRHVQGCGSPQPHRLRHRLDGHEPDHRRCVVRSLSQQAGADEEPRCHRGSRGGPERIVRVRPARFQASGACRWAARAKLYAFYLRVSTRP